MLKAGPMRDIISFKIKDNYHWWSGFDLVRRLLFFLVYTWYLRTLGVIILKYATCKCYVLSAHYTVALFSTHAALKYCQLIYSHKVSPKTDQLSTLARVIIIVIQVGITMLVYCYYYSRDHKGVDINITQKPWTALIFAENNGHAVLIMFSDQPKLPLTYVQCTLHGVAIYSVLLCVLLFADCKSSIVVHDGFLF